LDFGQIDQQKKLLLTWFMKY